MMQKTSMTRSGTLALAIALGTAVVAPGAGLAQTSPPSLQTAPPSPGAVPPAGAAPAAPGEAAAPAPGAPSATAPAAPGAPGAETTGAAPGAPGTATPPAPGSADTTNAVDNGNGTQTVENPYGLNALWKTGDAVSRTVLILLAIMSLGTWYIMITKFWEQARVFSASRAANKDFWKTTSVNEGIQRLKPASPFRYIAENGVSATQHHEGALTEAIDLHTWVTMAIQRAQETVSSRLQGGLAFLATVGSVSPFVGLFGTVWGIYHALTAIGAAGQASIDKVAGPVGEALIMTAIGLATAVPAVLGYNFLVRRNKTANEKVRNFGSDLHSILLSGRRVNVAQGSSSSATVTPVAARVA